MQCPTLIDFQFSDVSKDAIARIRDVDSLSTYLMHVATMGHLATIFMGSDALAASFNFYNTDFQTMSRGIKSVPSMKRHMIKLISYDTYRKTTGKERKFW